MTYVLICRDKPDALEVRLANRADHLAYAKNSDKVLMGGPLLEDGKMLGSLVILDVETRAEAEAWAAADPYGIAGLFSGVEIIEWKRVLG